MKIMILNASPKRRGGASRFFSGTLLRPFLMGHQVVTETLAGTNDFDRVLEQLEDIDALVISNPLYIDTVASHMLGFLQRLESLSKLKKLSFKLYVLSNSGFIEGIQNKPQFDMYRCFCERAGLEWCGGTGIGGGVMLYAVFICFVIFMGLRVVNIALNAASGAPVDWLDFLLNLSIYAFLFSGTIYGMAKLSRAVGGGRAMKGDFYTRAMIPSVVFVLIADIFMILAGLFNGRIVFFFLAKTGVHRGLNAIRKRLYAKASAKVRSSALNHRA